MQSKRRWYTRDQIVTKAAAFRERFAPGVAGAFPIAPIVEFQLKLEFVPLKNLRARTNAYGYLGADGRTIYIDETVFMEGGRLLDLVLLHETGHHLLHEHLLPKNHEFRTLGDCVQFHAGFTEAQVATFEVEAKLLCRHILLPADHLTTIFEMAIEMAADRFPSISSAAARYYVTAVVARFFDVEPERAAAAIAHDRLWRTAREVRRAGAFRAWLMTPGGGGG